jgi:hypothetical protein
MSLTSYRAAPPRVTIGSWFSRVLVSGVLPDVSLRREVLIGDAFCRPGSDLLSRVLRRSTISAGAIHGRVRNGNGCRHPAITTRSTKRMPNRCFEKLDFFSDAFDGHEQWERSSRSSY